jgi:hypothetical protein
VRVAYDAEGETFSVDAPADVEVVEGYWFAWMAFHPESSVFATGNEHGSNPSASEPDEAGGVD